ETGRVSSETGGVSSETGGVSSETGRVVEIAIKVSPVLAPHLFQALLPSVLRGIIDGERYPVVMSVYLGVIGRVLLQNSSFFTALLSQMALESNQEGDSVRQVSFSSVISRRTFDEEWTEESGEEMGHSMDQLLGSLIEMWVDRMDNITQPERRKLSSLALLSLLPSDNSVIQDKFCGIINICVEALHDVMTEDPDTGTFKE
ncbi:hypothetical protein NFI96_029098, partial [Prochilodus magdalenae]